MAYVYSKEDQAAGGGKFTRQTLDEGVYDMKLVRITAYLRDGTSEYPDPTPTLRFAWAWCDENGELYEGEEGEKYEVRDDIRLPPGFPEAMKYHEKTSFYKRLAEIAGVPITDQAAVKKIGIDPGDFIQTNAEIIDVISNPMDGKPDRKGFVPIVGILVAGVEQVGRICKLVVKKVPSKKDPTKFFNNVASIMQAQTNQPKRPPTRNAAPQQAAPAQPALVDAPKAPRPNTTEPLHAAPPRTAAPQVDTNLPF